MAVPSSTFTIDNPGSGVGDTAPANSNIICDRTGFKAKVGELIPEWTNSMVLPEVYEARHPQDLVKARAELNEGAIRPEQDDVFLAVNEVTASDL